MIISILLVILVTSKIVLSKSIGLFPDILHTPFELGVASGEPLQSSIVLWTRAQKIDRSQMFSSQQTIVWRIWEVENSSIQINGTTVAHPEVDFTISVVVDGLNADTYYHYQFMHLGSGNSSAVGRTRTSVADNSESELKIVVLSCSSIWSGYMNSYSKISELENVNVVLHLGDFIYPELDSYACRRIPPGLPSCRRKCKGFEMPVDDCQDILPQVANANCSGSTLDSFRWVYQYYLHDDMLRSLRQSHPMIVMFDNHDLDYSRSINISDSQAIQAFLEYIPFRIVHPKYDNNSGNFFRRRRFGKHLDLIVLDTRAIGLKMDGSYLGPDQNAWVSAVFKESQNITWRAIATTVAFSPWVINGWNNYINTILGVFLGICIMMFLSTIVCLIYERNNYYRVISVEESIHNEDDEESLLMNEGKKDIVVFRKRKYICLWCATAISVFLIFGIIIAWVVGFSIIYKVADARGLPITGPVSSLQLLAVQERNWEGHPQDRSRFLKMLRDSNVTKNNIWISGDL